MKRIVLHTAIAKDNGGYATGGDILVIGQDVSEDRAVDLVASEMASECAEDEAVEATEEEAPAPAKKGKA